MRALRLFAALFVLTSAAFFPLLFAVSAQATCVTTAQSIAAAATSPTVLNTAVSQPGDTATATPVLVQDTCGGDDVSYQVALPTAVTFQGTEYTAVYATTNSTITFGRQDNAFANYPTAPSISVNAYDWVVLDPANPNPSNAYPAGWRAPDEHLIITSSQAGFQVDLAVRPYGQNASANPLSTIVVTAAINPDNTLTITYLSDVQQGLNTRTGVRLPNGQVVTLEQAGLTRVYIAPVVTAEVVQPAPTPSPSPATSGSPEPSPSPTPAPQPSVQPSPTPSPVASPTSSPEPTPTPTPTQTPQPSPSPTPSPEPSVTPSPEPSVQPTPTPVPSPQPSPDPIPQPSPTPAPVVPTPIPVAPPAVEPTPQPQPETTPSPTTPPADPVTVPVVPEPQPTPQPQPVPTVPTPEPVAVTPQQQPQPEPTPAVEPQPIPEPVPVAEPTPEPVPVIPVEPEPPVAIPDPEGAIGEPPIEPNPQPEPPIEGPSAVGPDQPSDVPADTDSGAQHSDEPTPPEPSQPKPEQPEIPSQPPVEEPPAEAPPAEVTTAAEIKAVVDDVLSDGKLSATDAVAILDSLNADGEITKDEVNNLSDSLAADGKLTTAEKELVADALIQSVAPGETLTKEQIQDAGIAYQDLPPETPVEVRQDENGNEVIITADVAAALVLLENPAELIGAIFDDPGQAVQALLSIGADMSTEERKESTEAVVATVIAAGAAINAVAAAGGAASSGTRSGGSGGGSSSGGGASGDTKGTRRRKP